MDQHFVADSWSALGPRLAAIFEAVQSPLAVLSRDLEYIAVNSAYAAVGGRPVEQILGGHIFDVFPENPENRDDDAPTSLRRSLRCVLETAEADSMPLMRYDLHDGDEFLARYWHVTNIPILADDGEVELIVNNPVEVTTYIDERLRLEAAGHTVTATSPSQSHAIDEVFVAIKHLHRLNDLASSLVGASNPVEVGRAVIRDGLAMVGASGGSLVLANGDRLEIAGSAGVADDIISDWSSFTIEAGRDPFSDVLASGEPLFFEDRSSLLDRYPHHAEVVERTGDEAWAVLPLRTADDIAGAIGVIFDEKNSFDTPIRLVLYTLANLTAQAASRARLLVEQTVALRSIEQAFQPRLDVIAGVVTSDRYSAASAAAVAGGDWYDVIDRGDGTTLIVIGDVANHGAIAVGEMVRARSTVHTLAHLGLGAAEIATVASTVLSQLASTYTTCIVAILEQATLEFSWATAGHPYPALISASGDIEMLEPTSGPPLGSGFEHSYEVHRRRLLPGETLVLYTDGLIERADEPIDSGFDDLREALGRIDVTDPDLAERLFLDLRGDEHLRDDVAILTLHVDDASRP